MVENVVEQQVGQEDVRPEPVARVLFEIYAVGDGVNQFNFRTSPAMPQLRLADTLLAAAQTVLRTAIAESEREQKQKPDIVLARSVPVGLTKLRRPNGG